MVSWFDPPRYRKGQLVRVKFRGEALRVAREPYFNPLLDSWHYVLVDAETDVGLGFGVPEHELTVDFPSALKEWSDGKHQAG